MAGQNNQERSRELALFIFCGLLTFLGSLTLISNLMYIRTLAYLDPCHHSAMQVVEISDCTELDSPEPERTPAHR